jgi:hypothetical protein
MNLVLPSEHVQLTGLRHEGSIFRIDSRRCRFLLLLLALLLLWRRGTTMTMMPAPSLILSVLTPCLLLLTVALTISVTSARWRRSLRSKSYKTHQQIIISENTRRKEREG